MLLLIGSIAIAPVVLAQNSNNKPSALNITKLDDKTATISARFSTLSTREKKVGIFLDKEAVTLLDDGTGGDLRAGDGLFSAKVDFDFEALPKRICNWRSSPTGKKVISLLPAAANK
jgi:hypothetical protein